MTESSSKSGAPASANTEQVLDNIDAALEGANYNADPTLTEGITINEIRQPNVLRRAGSAVVRFAARLVSPEARAQHRAENHQANVAARVTIEEGRTNEVTQTRRAPESQPLFKSPAAEKWGQTHTH